MGTGEGPEGTGVLTHGRPQAGSRERGGGSRGRSYMYYYRTKRLSRAYSPWPCSCQLYLR